MKIKFDINLRPEIEDGKYNVFAGEKPARIICWDARGFGGITHIVAMVGNPGEPEKVLRYFEDGHLISDSASRGSKDLMLEKIPEVDLTEFESRLADYLGFPYIETKYEPEYKIVKDAAKELLEIAAGNSIELDGFVARDHSGSVCLYTKKPSKLDAMWYIPRPNEVPYGIPSETVKWEDDEPRPCKISIKLQ